MNLNKFGKRAYKCALRRGKVHKGLTTELLHKETVASLTEEMNEVVTADEVKASEHLPQYSAVTEELVDIIIVALTELHRRKIDIDSAVRAKIKYNATRK